MRYRAACLTHGELADCALRLAKGLSDMGVARGDRVAILQPNCPELIESMFAGFLGGSVVVPINARLHPEEVRYIVDNSRAAALIYGDEFNAALSTTRGPARAGGRDPRRGDIVMLGYWDEPEATAMALRDGWVHTGDLGAFDEHGYLSVLDSSKDMVVSGGHNVYAREVEEAILRHPGVSEVAVIGVPDDYWGEAMQAVVVPRDGAAPTGEAILAQCREDLAGFKKLWFVEFAPSLPKNASGKVLKGKLREPYWRGYERRVSGGRRPRIPE